MRNKMTFYISAFLAVALSCVSIIQAKSPKDHDGDKKNQLDDRVLARGWVRCEVDVVEPNGGTGEPHLSASLDFGQYLNLTGSASAYIYLDSGSKDELDKFCQEFVESTSSTAEEEGCTAGAIRTAHYVGGNYVSDSWFLDIICNGDRNQVVNAIGIQVEAVMLAWPLDSGQAIIQDNSAKRVESSLWEEFQLMRGQASGSTPLIRPDSSSESR